MSSNLTPATMEKFECTKCGHAWHIDFMIFNTDQKITTLAPDGHCMNWPGKCPECESYWYKWLTWNPERFFKGEAVGSATKRES